MVAHPSTTSSDADLLNSRELFKGILAIAADAVVSVDEQQKIMLFNQGAEAMFGYRSDEVLGRPLDVLLPDTVRAVHRHHIDKFGESDSPPRQMAQRSQIHGRRKDGTLFPAFASISRLKINGRIVATAIVRDVTKEREAETAIRELNDSLNHRASQLEAANRELESFSYSVSHDLRAPLRAIDGFSQLLLEDYAQILPEDGQDALFRVRAASQRMAQLIDDILDLSRLTRGAVNRSPSDLSAMAQSIADELVKSQPKRNVTFAIEPGLEAHADPHLIRIALTNLLTNSFKYTSKHDAAKIEFGRSATETGGHAYFVKDDGVGFDMAYADKLFGAFQRLHGMTEYPGNGIGLATVQRIIHKHGGQVWAEGAVDQGATFTFTLG